MRRACQALGLSRATAYRHLSPKTSAAPKKRPRSHRRIPDSEREQIVEVLDTERFIDQAPREVYATLLSEGSYLCSVRTMYRLLNERGAVCERRGHRKAAHHPVPRLEASAPNQVWSWDISKLPTFERGVFLNLYVVLDLYSRFVVAWMVGQRENSALAKQLFAEAITRHEVDPGTLVVHMDRGAPMTSHGFRELLGTLGVDKSYSRPRVSNDNAFSESHFHTLKYQPDYPGVFEDVEHGRRWCGEFFEWYNYQQHHDGLALFTPAEVFNGTVEQVARRREAAIQEAYRKHPERFVSGAPKIPRPPKTVRINPLDAAPLSAEAVLSMDEEELSGSETSSPLPTMTPAVNTPGAKGQEMPICT